MLFANEEALNICGLKKEEFIGKQIQDVAVTNDLIRSIIKDIFLPKPENAKSEQLKIYADERKATLKKRWWISTSFQPEKQTVNL